MILKHTKFLIMVLLIYISWYKEVFSHRDIIMYVILFVISALVFYDMYKTGNIHSLKIKGILPVYISLLFFSFLTGCLIAVNFSGFMTHIIRLFVFTVLCSYCMYISRIEGNCDWLLKIFVICAVFCALQTIFFGVSFNGGTIYTMSKNNNPNKLAVTMTLGVMGIIYNKEKLEKKVLLNLGLLLSFIYVTLLSASRKCFISIIFILIIWIKDYILDSIGKKVSLRKVFVIISLFMFFVISSVVLVKNFDSSSMYVKMKKLNTEFDSSVRIDLYRQAFDMWKKHPIIGVGYAQFQELNSIQKGYYSHSTYAELLSNTGLIGILIFLIPLLKKIIQCFCMLIKSKKISSDQNKTNIKYRLQMVLLFFLIELFLAAGQILIYELDHMLLLAILFFETDRLLIEVNVALSDLNDSIITV